MGFLILMVDGTTSKSKIFWLSQLTLQSAFHFECDNYEEQIQTLMELKYQTITDLPITIFMSLSVIVIKNIVVWSLS